MFRPLTIAGLLATLASSCSWPDMVGRRPVHAGFWFETVSYESSRLGGRLTADELNTIAAVARAELVTAFDGFNISLTDRRDARYRVRVVPEVRDTRMQRDVWVAGEARAAAGFGGVGAVSFLFLANGAMVYAPNDAGRAELVIAIGRGIGRAAVHEFAHQLLPKAPIHDSDDRQSYEYGSAARAEQYFGDMHWALAKPLLAQRMGR